MLSEPSTSPAPAWHYATHAQTPKTGFEVSTVGGYDRRMKVPNAASLEKTVGRLREELDALGLRVWCEAGGMKARLGKHPKMTGTRALLAQLQDCFRAHPAEMRRLLPRPSN